MAHICYHALTDEEFIIVAQRFNHDLLLSGFTQQAVADQLNVSQSTIASWSNGTLLIPHWRAMDLQKKMQDTELFLAKHLRPDFVKKFQKEIDTLCSHQGNIK